MKTRRMIPTDTKRVFSQLVSLKSIWTIWKNFFEQRSELQFFKYLTVLVLFSIFNISSLELWNKRKPTQQRGLRVANIALNQLSVHHQREFADVVLSKILFMRLFFSQSHPKFNANIATEFVSEVPNKKGKTRSLFYQVNLNFLRFSRHFNCDSVLTVFVSFLEWECSWLQHYPYWKGKYRVPDSKIQTTLKVFDEKKFSLCGIWVSWWVRYFRKYNLTLTFQIQLLR